MTLYAWKEGGGKGLKMNSGSKDLTIYILEKDVFILPQAWAKEKILSPHEEYLFCWFNMHSSVFAVDC